MCADRSQSAPALTPETAALLGSWGQRQADLQEQLARQHQDQGLGAALRALHRQQLETGFVRDDLDDVRHFRFSGTRYAADHFRVQFNPARARRFSGIGPAVPPRGVDPVHNGCFLCGDNIHWQSRGLELGYRLPEPHRHLKAWMNPFPLASCHVILASMAHEEQHWHGSSERLCQIVEELIDVVAALPGWLGFYNGVGAGASIPGHLHHHLMPRSREQGPFPMEQSFEAFGRQGWTESVYPIAFLHWRGTVEQLKKRMADWLPAWRGRVERAATANIIALNGAEGEPLDLIFVPRHPSKSRAEGLQGVVGAFEALGEIICSTPEELARIERGEIGYDAIAEMLSQVSIAP
jgi:diadenosine tetraphosphate (Ap4A) HIT family hydrolase